jgi:LacI family transcriptional regulator
VAFNLKMTETTIKDIADATGVSYATVSRTLNERSGVSPKTRAKILKTAKAMGYRPNIHARSLKTNQTFTIALIVPDISNPFFADIALAVNKSAFEKGYNTILCSSNWDPTIEEAQLQHIQDQRVDGIIFKPCDRTAANLWQKEGLSYIEVDNFTGGQKAAQLFQKCGYSRPAFIGGVIESVSNADRLLGFKSGFEAAGTPIPDENISFGSFTIENGYQAASNFFNRSPKIEIDCFFCGNDMIALGAMQYLAENNIKVPDDFGVIGFDDVYFASLPQIRMTTLSQPRDLMGVKAAEMLIRHINAGKNIQEEHILIQPELIIRNSTRDLR